MPPLLRLCRSAFYSIRVHIAAPERVVKKGAHPRVDPVHPLDGKRAPARPFWSTDCSKSLRKTFRETYQSYLDQAR